MAWHGLLRHAIFIVVVFTGFPPVFTKMPIQAVRAQISQSIQLRKIIFMGGRLCRSFGGKVNELPKLRFLCNRKSPKGGF